MSGDTDSVTDVFVYDRLSDAIERVSVNASGTEGNGGSDEPAISADGRHVAFQSAATNLVSGDTNGTNDVFIYHRQTSAIERVSVDASGTEGNGESRYPSISADSRYVAFESTAANLVSGDTNSVTDVFVYDRLAGATERVSVDESGTEVYNVSASPSISADGRYVAFESFATNLVSGDTNGVKDIFATPVQ